MEQYGLTEGYLLIFDFRKLRGEAGRGEEVIIDVGDRKKNIVEVYC